MIERKGVKIAKLLNWTVFKIDGKNQIGAPDRVFAKGNCYCFIEFKGLCEPLSAKQKHTHSIMREQGVNVEVVRTLTAFKALLWGMEILV